MSALFGFVQTINLKINYSEYQMITKTLLDKNLRMKRAMKAVAFAHGNVYWRVPYR
jgi:hypothetical protein